MKMSRKITRLFSGTILLGLAVIFSACTFPSLSSTTPPDYNATQTAFSFLFTQIATTPSPTITPSITNSATPSPTLDPFFLTLTPPVPSTFIAPTAGPRPLSYTLQSGEFPYCIARRFNLDPRELLAINNLNSGLIYSPGLVLTIPQSGRPFPSTRALHPHPTSYTVPEFQMTVYKVACYFGDADPLLIMYYNRLTSPILNAGMTLQIP